MNRKDAHLKYALSDAITKNGFDDYLLEYISIPSFGLEDVDIRTKIGIVDLEYPFFINAITGGSKKGDKINKDLEYVSKKTNIFLFPGSYSPFLNKDKISYPKNQGINLGIDKPFEAFVQGINKTDAKIVQVHVNMIQEMLMPEGDRNFEKWEENLKEIIKHISIPIILKETGFGMGRETFIKAKNLGIKILDISGKGGTNFASIENRRRKSVKEYYEEIGYSTTESLEIAKEFKDDFEIIASGGIRNPLDIVKALALGADAVGISRAFLEILELEGRDALVDRINTWKKDIKNMFLLTGSRNIEELRGKIRIK
ncbi:type 2 isopentenyl-diphosphate Delta-isomerase [Streptobacillus felis]|uniref:Isopentenyl-diphosphate delta-isomerase n=1 Tax=Streptobacillus felis TaxID=1384509 RepID=A0A7Z0PG74_9FUSO|nr:type 2 isopentenyl-diphosphate Delta-isomerase [Streptobacillus felis]NYV27490.1 type 2 isopentenyl-diphosphate Delta-isomerase [Streptobacillus felis]